MISNRRNWKIRTIRTIRQGQSGLVRYPFVAPLLQIQTDSRGAKKTWVSGGYLDVVVRLTYPTTVHTQFVRLFESFLVWVPQGITSYWLNMRPRPWIPDIKLTISEYVGEWPGSESLKQIKSPSLPFFQRFQVVLLPGSEQLDQMEFNIDQLRE